jgi:hypothetical protein
MRRSVAATSAGIVIIPHVVDGLLHASKSILEVYPGALVLDEYFVDHLF